MKRFLKILGVLILVVTAFAIMPKQNVIKAANSTTYFAGGEGTVDNPYQISTTQHLDNIRYYPSAHYKLVNDLVFTSQDYNYGQFYNSGCYWNPIPSFTGSFDGNNYSIDGLKINRTWAGETVNGVTKTSATYGLFADVNGSIKDLTLSNVDIKISVKGLYNGSTSVCVGAIAGILQGKLENCAVSGNVVVTGQTNYVSAMAGGLVGDIYGSNVNIYNCYNAANIEGTCNSSQATFIFGGIVGWLPGRN